MPVTAIYVIFALEIAGCVRARARSFNSLSPLTSQNRPTSF